MHNRSEEFLLKLEMSGHTQFRCPLPVLCPWFSWSVLMPTDFKNARNHASGHRVWARLKVTCNSISILQKCSNVSFYPLLIDEETKTISSTEACANWYCETLDASRHTETKRIQSFRCVVCNTQNKKWLFLTIQCCYCWRYNKLPLIVPHFEKYRPICW